MSLNKNNNQQFIIVPEINLNKCESDGACVKKCPHDVFAMAEISAKEYAELTFLGKLRTKVHGKWKANVVAPEQCQACGACVQVCPEKAIKLIRIQN